MIETLAFSEGWGVIGVGETLAFPGPPERPAKQVSASAQALMRDISSVLEDLVLCAIEKRTAVEFKTVRGEVFPKYLEAVRALSSLLRIVVPRHVIERLNRELFCELEADLREKGLAAFGSDLRDQGVFTVWTLRKISDLLTQISNSVKPDAKPSPEALEIISQILCHAIWTRFHVNCLNTSIQRQTTLYPEVSEIVIDGLRAAVNSYGLTRRLLDIVTPLPEPQVEPVEWDTEEEALLYEAKRDMLVEFSEAV